MDEKTVVDYFVVAGLPPNPEPLGEFSKEVNLKTSHAQAPITDIAVIIRGLKEEVPEGYECIETTPTGLTADLNHGSIRSPSVFLCYRRGRDKAPLMDIGVLYENKERVMADSQVVHTTPHGRPANVNNSTSRIYLTYRRAPATGPCNQLVVTDICVILTSKGETPPHAFCQINKTLNKGMLGSDVYICYKKSMGKADYIAYKPGILGRFPLEDHYNFPFPESVPLFCLPMGATIECWAANAEHPQPVFSTFVLTVSAAAEKVYGAAVTFYEDFPEDQLSKEQKRKLKYDSKTNETIAVQTLHTNKSICLLSHWPFFDTFEKFLFYLHGMSITGSHLVPIERYISHFMYEVPFPSPQRPRILIQLDHDTITLAQPEDSPLTLSGASFRTLLQNLGPDNCMKVLLFALTEQKILIHSLRQDVLTSVAEAVSMMIFPFHWQCPYIPLCPLGLSDVLSAPLPFIVGVDSRYFDLFEPPQDVNCVDLDTNTISLCEEKKGLSEKLLPKKPAKILQSTLLQLFEKICMESSNASISPKDNLSEMAPIDRDFKKCRLRRVLELEIQEAFLRFMAQILKGFRSFLLPITKAPTLGTTDPNSLFDLQGFLKSRDKAYHKFFSMVMKTQTFIRFIEERSFVTDKDASLAFFDECTEKVDIDSERPEPKLLEYDDSHQNDRTVFITPPEPVGLPSGVKYSYTGFPKLKPELFLQSEMKIPGQNKSPACPNSPMAKRTMQEVKSAQKSAKKQSQTPYSWAKCLLSYCYSLWFICLPSYVKATHSKTRALRTAYDALMKMQQSKLQPPDEMCYRVLMQLCGLYSQPVLAVRVLFEMKKNGIQPNAITYGYYNKAVLESKWPSSNTRAYLLWNKLRNVILGVGKLRRGIPSRIFDLSEANRSCHTSTDSNLEDTQNELNKFASDSVNTPTLIDDQASTEGSSDVGYSSMILDETGKSSSSINSQSQSSSALNEIPAPQPCKPALKDYSKIHSDSKSSEKLPSRLRFDAVDFKESDEFRNRVGSIVCHSITNFESNNSISTLKGNTIDSAAGLLITSQNSLYDEPVCENNSLGSVGGRPPTHRKRHKSAGDYARRANEGYRYRHRSGPNNNVNLCLSLGNSENHNDSTGKVLRLRSDSFGNDLKIVSGLRARNASRGRKNIEHTPNKSDELIMDIMDDMPIEMDDKIDLKESSFEESKSNSSTRQNTPIRTPVTENDPLGFFTDIQEELIPSDNHQSTPAYDLEFYNKNQKPSDSFLQEDIANNQDNDTVDTSNVCLRSEPGRANISKDYLTKFKRRSADESTVGGISLDKNILRKGVESLPPSRRVSQVTSPTLSPPNVGMPRPTSSPRTVSQPSLMLFEGFKLAANAVVNKFSELRQSISAPGSKTSSYPKPYEMEKLLLYDDDEDDNISNDSHRASMDYLSQCEDPHVMQESLPDGSGDGKPLSADSSLLSRIYTKNIGPWSAPSFSHLAHFMNKNRNSSNQQPQKSSSSILMEVVMTTCSRCYNCNCMLYDEEIMAGWSADVSNLNTKCQFCSSKLVPFMNITIKDYHSTSLGDISQSKSDESIISIQSSPTLYQQQVASPSPESKLSTAESYTSDNFMMFEDLPDSCDNLSECSSPLMSPHNKSNFSAVIPIPTRGTKIERRRCTSECHTSTTESTRMSNPKPIPGVYKSFRNPQNEESPASSFSSHRRDEFVLKKHRILEPITVPYLSPLVLRKEVETVLDQEGDKCLLSSDFFDEHPIIFWNLVWYFKRIDFPSHLPSFILVSPSIHKDHPISKTISSTESKSVLIRCMWDNLKLHEEAGQPMYLLWNQSKYQSTLVHALVTEQQAFSKPVMEQIVHYVQCNNLLSPIRLMLNQSRVLLKRNKKLPRHRSVYRDILFLALTALGRNNIDNKAFDREYKKSFIKLTVKQAEMLQSDDRPPTLTTMWCRQMFTGLEL